MESSFLEQDSAVEKAANVPAAIKVLFDEMNEKPATTFEEVDIPLRSMSSRRLAISSSTAIRNALRRRAVSTLAASGTLGPELLGPFQAPYRALINGGCGGLRTIGFVCGNATTGPLTVDACYASVLVCRCA